MDICPEVEEKCFSIRPITIYRTKRNHNTEDSSTNFIYTNVSNYIYVGYRLLVGKRPLGRPRHRWVDNIRMDRRGGMGCVDWIGLAQDRNRWRALVN
jgi:hypothetical protein